LAKKMSLLEHVDELRKRLLRIIVVVGVLTLFFFTFGIKDFKLSENTIYLPYPSIYKNIAAQFLGMLRNDLVPSYVEMIVVSPGEMIVSLVYISLFLGIAVGMPVIVYELMKFISPGLYPREKSLIAKIVLPSVGLFLAGVVFSYFLVIPFALDFLYLYPLYLDFTSFLTIDNFISFVLFFIFAFGLSFQLPIVQVGLTKLHVVDAAFWRRNFSYAVVAMIIFGAVVTPDGSGITMFMVAAPMIVLYVLGYLVSTRSKPKVEE
jgi:sec-independent protein translocase protein TatC